MKSSSLQEVFEGVAVGNRGGGGGLLWRRGSWGPHESYMALLDEDIWPFIVSFANVA